MNFNADIYYREHAISYALAQDQMEKAAKLKAEVDAIKMKLRERLDPSEEAKLPIPYFWLGADADAPPL